MDLPDIKNNARIGILGGSFDPPHLGHAMMTLAVSMTQDLDEIWILPCADHTFKEGLSSFDKRVEMCERTFRHISNARVLRIEENLPKPSYTALTLKTIKEVKPDIELFFIMGADLVEEVPEWTNADDLTDYAQFMIVPREGYPLVEPPPELGNPTKVDIDITLPELSSTFIQKLQKRGVSTKNFLEREVYRMTDQRKGYDHYGYVEKVDENSAYVEATGGGVEYRKVEIPKKEFEGDVEGGDYFKLKWKNREENKFEVWTVSGEEILEDAPSIDREELLEWASNFEL